MNEAVQHQVGNGIYLASMNVGTQHAWEAMPRRGLSKPSKTKVCPWSRIRWNTSRAPSGLVRSGAR
eukprot:CAMPEP_0115681476 /NCGR_PEP_ID=MMETSP0272-20121206/57344_1 /TAXON_ID=71861 /ORGANISM="Scrippsiella trochoidea, Strain CCMP3099" /LENGTH=65 /DNA_ID=CAMNT_0003120793 /DNA_START=42 /DNA_END=234 /DNA_ORIENTATION=+